VKPTRYRKAPVEIEAWEWEGGSLGASEIIDWVTREGGTARYHDELAEVIAIDTLEGTITAQPGDFIIKGIVGEFYPCKPAIFFHSYEPL